MPRPEPSAYIWDIREACCRVQTGLSGVDKTGYLVDEMRRLAIKRLLITIGEAVNQLAKIDPALASELGDVSGIVSFRNALVHGYFKIDHDRVWGVIADRVPPLRAAADEIWRRLEPSDPSADGRP